VGQSFASSSAWRRLQQWPPGNGAQPLVASGQLGPDGHGGRYLGVLTPFASDLGFPADLGWSLAILHDAAQIQAPVRTVVIRNLAIQALILVALLALAARQGARLAVPIERLADAAGYYGAANFSHRVEVKTGDEVERLAQAMNRMADRLQEHERALLEKTAALQKTERQLADALARLREEAERLEETVQLRTRELRVSRARLAEAYEATLEGWARALDLRDRETEGHTRRVTEMAVALAASMGLDEDALLHLRRGALLHDIGKMGVPDSILHKPGPLTEAEWAVMRRHPTYAREMLVPITYLRPALDVPYRHHERWDGSGYPDGLSGEEIPLAARIFAVADVWDALCSDRPYRKAWPAERAEEYIRQRARRDFDPQVVEAFLAFRSSGGAATAAPPLAGAPSSQSA
jgi:putative nucleotidyltransferase with HDIG domain